MKDHYFACDREECLFISHIMTEAVRHSIAMGHTVVIRIPAWVDKEAYC